MLGKRFVRAVVWGLLAGGGLVAGLAMGGSLASTPADSDMLIQLGGGAGGVAALVGFAMPPKKKPNI